VQKVIFTGVMKLFAPMEIDETCNIWMKNMFFIQNGVISVQRFGSKLAIASIEKRRIFHQILLIKYLYHFLVKIHSKKTILQY